MNPRFKQSIVNIAEICAHKQVHEVILSPGSRSAPLALAFLRHPKITCRTVVDERSAGFIALGLAQQLEKPVALVCTSGTAALNYAPAVAEAFYQQIPLVVFTADRPPEWIDQNDGQTLGQIGIYANFCRGNFVLPVDDAHPDARWHAERIVSDAINSSLWPVPGPVHVNVPLREPLYPESDFEYEKASKIISLTPSQAILDEKTRDEIATLWQRADRKLIVAGLHKPSPRLAAALRTLGDEAAVVCDITSNLCDVSEAAHSDMILGTADETTREQLRPDLLVTFGGPVVSKNLKLFLRKYRPKAHWHLQNTAPAVDTFQSLTRIFPVSAEYFFSNLSQTREQAKTKTRAHSDYTIKWRALETTADKALHHFLADLPHCEFSAMNAILNALPQDSHLQLGNSFIVRLASFIGLPVGKRLKIKSNRGTCGIDGTLSTAVGAALTTRKMTTVILGDLAFFYDRNALWHDYLPANLRIVILNNQGGGIFRIIDGPSTLPELEKHFEVEHRLSAEHTAAEFGLEYHFCDSKAALEQSLSNFFESGTRPAILEAHTDKRLNVETFQRFKQFMREIR